MQNPENLIDLWIIDKFSILPTDERFLNLYEEQKSVLFEGLCELPDLDIIKNNIQTAKRIREYNNKTDEEIMPIEAQNKIKENFIKSGKTIKQAEEKVKEMINTRRSFELEKIKNAQ